MKAPPGSSHAKLGVAPITGSFNTAYQGPREKLGKPILILGSTPTGTVVQKVHTKNDQLARARNQQRDRLASGSEKVKTSTSRQFNFFRKQGAKDLPPPQTPKVFRDAAAKRRAALKARLLAKQFEKAAEIDPKR